MIDYFPWWRAGDTPSETQNDEARKIFDREHLVPVKRRATLKPEIVQEIAQSILEVGQQVPILVRPDGDCFVLVEGLHRLEACKALGAKRRSTDTLPRPRSTNRTRFRAKWRAAAKMKRDAPVHPRSRLAPPPRLAGKATTRDESSSAISEGRIKARGALLFGAWQ